MKKYNLFKMFLIVSISNDRGSSLKCCRIKIIQFSVPFLYYPIAIEIGYLLCYNMTIPMQSCLRFSSFPCELIRVPWHTYGIIIFGHCKSFSKFLFMERRLSQNRIECIFCAPTLMLG